MASFSDDDNWENSDEGPIDCDEDNEEGQDAPIISFTNILFGNINDNGELEDDEFLDQVSLTIFTRLKVLIAFSNSGNEKVSQIS